MSQSTQEVPSAGPFVQRRFLRRSARPVRRDFVRERVTLVRPPRDTVVRRLARLRRGAVAFRLERARGPLRRVDGLRRVRVTLPRFRWLITTSRPRGDRCGSLRGRRGCLVRWRGVGIVRRGDVRGRRVSGRRGRVAGRRVAGRRCEVRGREGGPA